MSDFSDLEDMMRAVSSCFHHRTYQKLYKKKPRKVAICRIEVDVVRLMRTRCESFDRAAERDYRFWYPWSLAHKRALLWV
jgi:hypothetical protein